MRTRERQRARRACAGPVKTQTVAELREPEFVNNCLIFLFVNVEECILLQVPERRPTLPVIQLSEDELETARSLDHCYYDHSYPNRP